MATPLPLSFFFFLFLKTFTLPIFGLISYTRFLPSIKETPPPPFSLDVVSHQKSQSTPSGPYYQPPLFFFSLGSFPFFHLQPPVTLEHSPHVLSHKEPGALFPSNQKASLLPSGPVTSLLFFVLGVPFSCPPKTLHRGTNRFY